MNRPRFNHNNLVGVYLDEYYNNEGNAYCNLSALCLADHTDHRGNKIVLCAIVRDKNKETTSETTKEFVTWKIYPENQTTHHGHYFSDIQLAFQDFQDRINQ